MNIPAEFFRKLNEEIDIAPIILLDNANCLDNHALDIIIDNEDMNTVLKILKTKLIMIYKHKITANDYDLTILLNKLQEKELNIIHDVMLYALLIQKSSNILKQLLNESSKSVSDVNEKDRQTIRFNLELLDVILEICTITGNDLLKEETAYENISKLLMNLLCNHEKEIQIKIVKDVIPKYIDCTKDYDILYLLWSNLKDNSFFYDYILFVLEQYFMPASKNEFSVLDQTEFWITLQTNLTSENPFVKKQSVYLLKRSVQTILQNERYIEKSTSNLDSVCDIIQWNKNVTHEYRNAWKNFFLLCDTSNEKQLHLIEPTFKLYNSLALLHYSWRKCITTLFISHPHSAVVRNTVSQILTQKWICDLDILINGLNNNYLYDSTQDSSIFNDLVVYISNLNRTEFEKFIALLAKQQPSPVPFYYICKSLENFNKPEFNIKLIIDLIYSSEKVPHLYLRKAIQHSLFLLLTKIQLTDDNFQNEIFFKDLLKIIFLFVNIGYLKREHCSWKKMLGYFKKDICTKQFENIFSNMCQANFQFSPKEYAVWFVIMADLEYDIQHECSDILKYIQTNNDCSTKLTFILILCHVIKIYNGKIPEEFYLLHLKNMDKLLNEILTICTHLKNQCLEFISNIEFIIGVMYSNENIREQTCDLLIDFWNKLRQAGLYDWYIILSKKIIQIYDQTILIQTHDTSRFMNMIENIKQAKDNYLSNDSVEISTNNVKRQILSNYYYTKMCLTSKLLMEVDIQSILNEFIEYYDKAGTEILLPVLNALLEIIENKKNILRSGTFRDECRTLLCRCKTDIFNLRTNEIFRPAFAKLVKIITNPRFSSSMHEFRDSVIDEVFDASQTVTGLTGLRNEILHHALCGNELTIKIETLGEALLYGPILRKDQRIEFDTCAAISNEKYMQELDEYLVNPCELDAEVRSQAAVILLHVLRHSSNSHEICERVWHILNEKYAEYTGKRYFGDSQIHLLKLRIMQTLHLIVNHLSTDYMYLSTKWLLGCLVNESEQPSVKILIQWAVMRIKSRYTNPESFIADKLIPVLNDSKGTSCTSLFPLMYHIVKGGNVDTNIVQDCMNYLLPYTMGQHFNIRYYAQVTIKRIYEIYETIEDFKKIYSPIYNTVCEVIDQTSSDKSFDMILTYTDLPFTLETLYYDIPRLTNVTHTEWLPVEYFDSLTDMKIVKNTDNSLKQLHTNTRKPITWRSECTDGSTNVQKKIDPFAAGNIGNTSEVATSKANLIVVASLIDRAPNLGGLSRTCEVFGVRQYVLNNVQFVKNKEYQSLSMSSEKWVDTIEVKVENLPVYLRDMKRKGYKIVGAEQTADSQRLDTFQFEKNTVLLLGNEKEGISPNLIHLLDQCIEIPQFGQIRSLNVHVAGALFIWEYAKQHCQNN